MTHRLDIQTSEFKMNIGKNASVPENIDPKSCPLARVSIARAQTDVSMLSDEAFQICKAAIYNQINRKISKEESFSILAQHGANVAAATLVDDVLNAFDKHVPSVTKQELPSTVNRRCRLWTYDEDCLLLAGLLKYGLGDWKSIAFYVGGGRSRSQCFQRWGRALDPKIAKVPWTAEEERVLLELVRKHGEHAWATIAKELGSRSDVQCRYRYFQIKKCNTEVESDPSSEDDAKTSMSVAAKKVLPQLSTYMRITDFPKDPFFGFLNNEDLFKGPKECLIPPLRPRVNTSQNIPDMLLALY